MSQSLYLIARDGNGGYEYRCRRLPERVRDIVPHVPRRTRRGQTNAFLTFNSGSHFKNITQYPVCDSPKAMPNAYITHKNFWNDLQRVIDFKAFTGATSCQ